MSRKSLLRPEKLPWRIGRKVGRTIFVQLGPAPDDHDPLIGLMDTKALAQAAVDGHNAVLTGDRITRTPKRRVADRLTRTPKRATATPPNPGNPTLRSV